MQPENRAFVIVILALLGVITSLICGWPAALAAVGGIVAVALAKGEDE